MTKLVGILNYNNNSFSDGGCFSDIDAAYEQIQKMFSDGADIVDIGATATSYGVVLLTEDEEWNRLKPLLSRCRDDIKKISIDTFYQNNAAKAIELGVCMINDVSGGKDLKMLDVIAKNKHVKYVLMKSLILPADKNVRVGDIYEIYKWGQQKIQQCLELSISHDQLIFDPGIGFTTNPKQSLEVIKNVKKFKTLGVPLYIGHSRKSFFESITKYPPPERDIETLAASIYMLFEGVDYLRVHNVNLHARAFTVLSELHSCYS